MLKKNYEKLKNKEDLRETLSFLKSEIKNKEAEAELKELMGDGDLLIGLLLEEEPKVRKNAALLIGELGLQQAREPLLAAYNMETTLFVKSAYLTALSKLEVSDYLDVWKKRLTELTAIVPAENEKKHINEEIRILSRMITGTEGITKHTFTGLKIPHEMILTTNRSNRDVTLVEVEELSAEIRRKSGIHPLGVFVYAKEVIPFTKLRTYRELLFTIHTQHAIKQQQELTKNAENAAEEIWNSDMWSLIEECHKENNEFFFRLELRGQMEMDKKALFAKKFAAQLERLSGRRLVNSTGDYEIEIRLIENREGDFVPFIKLYTIPMDRFAYRKNTVSSSIHPAMAAMLVKIAQPYLKEEAQILDPFCGVGTMLIERDILVPAREKYGIDIYGAAVEKGRENAAAAGQRINFIHRDYFDFKHEYKFDEIVTNMPVRGRKTKEEMDDFYAEFFEKSKRILTSDGVMIFYSNEEGFVKKQLRLHTEYKLLQEISIRKKEHFSLYIVGIKG